MIYRLETKKFSKKFKENNLDFQWFVDEVKTEFKWQRYIYQLYAKKLL